MKRIAGLLGAGLLAAAPAFAGEKVVAVNTYVQNSENWPVGSGVYWRQDNNGSFEVKEGPLESGFSRCIGAGFHDQRGARGEGVCFYETPTGTFTMTWRSHPDRPNDWQIISGTGAYEGIRGEGTTITRIASEFQALQLRVSEWSGEIELPE